MEFPNSVYRRQILCTFVQRSQLSIYFSVCIKSNSLDTPNSLDKLLDAKINYILMYMFAFSIQSDKAIRIHVHCLGGGAKFQMLVNPHVSPSLFIRENTTHMLLCSDAMCVVGHLMAVVVNRTE